MGIRRPIEFAHISLPYGFTTMPILETGAISSKRAADTQTHTYSGRCRGLTQSGHDHRDHRGQLLGAQPACKKSKQPLGVLSPSSIFSSSLPV